MIDHREIGSDHLWVGTQLSLFVGIAIASLVAGRRPGRGWKIAALAPLAGSALITAKAAADLSKNITMFPTPVEDGQLVDTGIYSVMRHPMYFSALLLALSNLLFWRNRPSVVGFITIVAFFIAKAGHEERLLDRRYPEYAQYRQRVPGGIVPRPSSRRRA